MPADGSIPTLGQADFAQSEKDRISQLRDARREAQRELWSRKAELITALDTGDAMDTADELETFADDVAEAVATLVARLGKLDPAILSTGRPLSVADTCDWLERVVEIVTEPMTPAAARVLVQAVKLGAA